MRAVIKTVISVLLGVGILAMASEAVACNTGCPPPAPPTPPHNPYPPHTPCTSCGGGGGSNSNINVNVKVSASASASGSAFGSAGAAVYGGGYGNWSQTPGYPQAVGGLNVLTGDEQAAFESYSEQSTYTRTMVLQANCIDDTGVPHPASQVNGDRAIDNRYVGEIYRCIAGTHMQLIMVDACGDVAEAAISSRDESYSQSDSNSSHAYDNGNGNRQSRSERSDSHQSGSSSSGSSSVCHADYSHINFDNGKTMTCSKNQALWFENGALTCKAQIPQRQCNERSLLRRFGAGIKVLTVTRTESITKQRQTAAVRSSNSTSYMSFDGGVGGFVQ